MQAFVPTGTIYRASFIVNVHEFHRKTANSQGQVFFFETMIAAWWKKATSPSEQKPSRCAHTMPSWSQ